MGLGFGVGGLLDRFGFFPVAGGVHTGGGRKHTFGVYYLRGWRWFGVGGGVHKPFILEFWVGAGEVGVTNLLKYKTINQCIGWGLFGTKPWGEGKVGGIFLGGRVSDWGGLLIDHVVSWGPQMHFNICTHPTHIPLGVN